MTTGRAGAGQADLQRQEATWTLWATVPDALVCRCEHVPTRCVSLARLRADACKAHGQPQGPEPGRCGLRASGPSDRLSQAGPSNPAGCHVQAQAGGPRQQTSDASRTGAWGRAAPAPVVPPQAPMVGSATEKKAWAASGSLGRRVTETSGARGGIRKWRVIPVLLVEDQPWWELPASWGPPCGDVGGPGGGTATGQGRRWSWEPRLGAQPLCTPRALLLVRHHDRPPGGSSVSAERRVRAGRLSIPSFQA